MKRLPLPVLTYADRVFALAPSLTWRLRFAIFLEVLRRDVELGEDAYSTHWVGL